MKRRGFYNSSRLEWEGGGNLRDVVDQNRKLPSVHIHQQPHPIPLVECLGLRVWGLEMRVQGLECGVWCLGFGVWGLDFRVSGFGFRF